MVPECEQASSDRRLPIICLLVSASLLIMTMKSGNTSELPTETRWSKSQAGIRSGLKINNIASDSINLRLCFSNISGANQRIFFIENAFFRSFQSYFMATNQSGEIILLTPPSPAHGYVVDVKDFLLLEPDTVLCFDETLQLSTIDSRSISQLSWIYRNDIHRWQGGVSTFDGQTRHLFDDNNHPDLWVGELQVAVQLAE